MVSYEFLDELFATAKTFTRHIHQAALEEMEKAAKTKSKETVATISRPTSIAMPSQTKRSLAGKARAKKQGEGVQKLLSRVPGGNDDDDDDPDSVPAWIGTCLHGLSKYFNTVAIHMPFANSKSSLNFVLNKPSQFFWN